MSTLCISPGACSLASHIAVRELELPILIGRVALRTPDSPIHDINPLGRVPALQLGDGTVKKYCDFRCRPGALEPGAGRIP